MIYRNVALRLAMAAVLLGLIGVNARAADQKIAFKASDVHPEGYPTVQAVILLFSVVYVLLNLLVDVTYTLLDPRIRY